MLFCPVRGVTAGATQRLRKGAAGLLQRRLRFALPAFAGLLAISALRLFFVEPSAAPIFAAGALFFGAIAVWVWVGRSLELATARRLEFATFAVLMVSLAASEFYFLGAALAVEDVPALAQALNRMPGIYGIIVLAYVILIPGTLRRNLVISAIAIATSIGVVEVVAYRSGHVTELFTLAERLEYISFALLVMGVAAALATFGARALDEAQRGIEKAGDVGMYRLLGKLGAGGMGEVWQAEHRMLARPAAIKIIRRDLADRVTANDARTVQLRFEREARATASLQSPHTVQLYDFGVTQEGTFFYVMEYLDGMDLADLIDRFGPLPASRAIFLLRQAAESLAEAHAHGLVHRDIKPGNLHVGRCAGRHDWVRVLDFGLVKSFDADDEAGTELTREGVTTGTPAYFPPEMAQGASSADARSDIYALSAVAYWLVTGQTVFDGAGAMDMVVRHIRDEPVPPSRRVEIPIPPALDELILKGLAKSPEARPRDMNEFIAALDAIELEPKWDERRAADWWQLNQPLKQPRRGGGTTA